MFGNVFEHGFPTTDHDWSLKTKVKEYKNTNEDGTFVIRTCLNCYNVFEKADVCPYCGTPYELTQVEIENIKEAKLKKVEEAKAERMQQWRNNLDTKVENYKNINQCKTWGEYLAFARVKNYKIGYAYIMAKRNGIIKGKGINK